MNRIVDFRHRAMSPPIEEDMSATTAIERSRYGYGSVGDSSSVTGAYGSQAQQQYRGRGPRGYSSDDRIRDDVCDCLTGDPQIDASNLVVTVKNGEVTLTGTVNAREDKRRAADLVEDLSGVKDVHDNLRVTMQQKTGAQTGNAAADVASSSLGRRS